MHPPLTIGYSPCPNDTFIFHGLVHGRVPLRNFRLAEPVLEDVETLNGRALRAELDITKLSFHALGHVLDDYIVLNSGSALGRGCGPLLVTRPGMDVDLDRASVAVPGVYTTAAMLLRLYAPEAGNVQVMRFEEIMAAVADGRVDYGVIIHESRFTYQEQGLLEVQDLGAWWEEETGLPIPLGCIAARRRLPEHVLRAIDGAVRQSLLLARGLPDRGMAYIRQHAQEMDDAVLRSHIALYVNDFSLELGKEGRAAVAELLRRGRKAGLFPATGSKPWCLGHDQD